MKWHYNCTGYFHHFSQGNSDLPQAESATREEPQKSHLRSLTPPPPLPPPLDTPPATPKQLVVHQSPSRGKNLEAAVESSGYEDSDWDTLAKYKWFWGFMNRGDCEIKLYNEGEMGNFVVRLNSNQRLILSLW